MLDEFEKYRANLMADDPTISLMLPRADGYCLIVKRLLFHWTLLLSEIGDYVGYDDRWCYATQTGANGAEDAARRWLAEGTSEPTMWHRHPKTARRRPEGDPSREYFAS